MTNWFDLPQEVKQLIFYYYSSVDSIVYVPRDRRKKEDLVYLRARHFYDILLVSKTFVTPNDFAFSILQHGKLTFDCFNELRRLVDEVSPIFKQAVRRIHFRRSLSINGKTFTDSFDGFSNIANVLSTHFPQLRQIHVSMPEYCASIGQFNPSNKSSTVTQDMFEMMLAYAFQRQDGVAMGCPSHFWPRLNTLPHVAASFLGNRSSRMRDRHEWWAWTRPQAWLRRLLVYAEEANIEVIFQIALCITNVIPRATRSRKLRRENMSETFCWSMRGLLPRWQWENDGWSMHIEAEMSTKDYVLRVTQDGETLSCRQRIIKKLIHAPTPRGRHWLQSLLKDLKYPGYVPDYAF